MAQLKLQTLLLILFQKLQWSQQLSAQNCYLQV